MKNPVFSPSATQFLSQLERMYVDGTLSTDQIRTLAEIYFGASPPFHVITQDQITSHLTEADLNTCRTGSFGARYRVLVKLSGRGLVSLDLLARLSEGEADQPTSSAGGTDDDEYKMARTVAIELWPNAQGELVAYARLKETSTLSKLDRNRLCRKFGSDSLLTVRFAMVSASLWDKRAWAEASLGGRALFDPDRCRVINILRLNNLLSPDYTSPHRLSREDIAWTCSSELHRLCELQREAFEKLSTIRLAGRTFSFLTATAAGVHDQRYIFTSTNRTDLLQWAMSRKSFKELRTAPIKLALRLALLNSTSIATIEIAPERVHWVADLLSDGAKAPSHPDLIMTDGCGRISLSCAKSVWSVYKEKQRLGAQAKISRAALYGDEDASGHEARKAERFSHIRDDDNDLPSAFQIRFGGSKGMLVVTHNAVEMGNFDIIFAESMGKFETPDRWPEHRVLEIMDFSWPLSEVVFNSEILDVLYGNPAGCGAAALQKYFEYQLYRFLETECKDLLQSREAAFEKAIASDDFLSVKLLLAGYPPHIAFMVGFYRKTLQSHHFPIPGAHRLYGVPDCHRSLTGPPSAGLLEFGEVYLQVNDTAIEGEVLILKEPCFHGSDVRKFRAVNKPELKHLKNVLVFSTRGPVSPASTIAGSDLDGDKFVVITEESGLLSLVSPPQWEPPRTAEAKEAEEAEETEVEAEAEEMEMEEAELDEEQVNNTLRTVWQRCYIATSGRDVCTFSDLLGLRACLVAASGPDWPLTEKSRLLSQLLSQAVDAPKSDKWVQLAEVKDLLPTIPQFPHYHLRALSSQVYPHNSLRGCLYDLTKDWIAGYLECHKIKNPLGQRSHKTLLQCNFGQNYDHALNDEMRLSELLKPIQREVDLNYRDVIDLVAFYSQFWKWGFITEHERAHPYDNLPDRRLWRSHPEELRVLLRYPPRHAGLSALQHTHRLCNRPEHPERPLILSVLPPPRRSMISLDQFREFLRRYPLMSESLLGREKSIEWYHKRVECGVELLQDQPPSGKWMTSLNLNRYARMISRILNEEITTRRGCEILDWESNAVLISLVLLGYCRDLLWSGNTPSAKSGRYSTINYAGDGYNFLF